MRTVTPAWVAVALAILYFLFGFHPIWDIDVFWHIEAGRWIFDHRTLPTSDIFSAVDEERGWITFQWLYEVVVYGLDRTVGLAGVRVLHAALCAAAVGWWAWWVGRRHGVAMGALAASVLMVLFADRLRVRPDAFNLLFMVLLWPTLVAPRWRKGALLSIAVIAGFWANIHAGGALLVPVLLAARLGGRGADSLLTTGEGRLARLWSAVKLDLGVWFGVVALMCLMPGFWRGTYQAFFMLGPSEEFIPEWMTTFEFLFEHAGSVHEWVAGLLPLLLLVGFLVGVGAAMRRGGKSASLLLYTALAIPLVALSLRHVRFLWLGAFVLPLWLEVMGPPGISAFLERGWRWVVAVAVAALLLVGLDGHYHLIRNGGSVEKSWRGLGEDLEAGEFPVGAADFLAQSSFEGKILNHAPWGGYLLYRLGDRVRVFTDGRGNFGPIETQLLSTWDSSTRRHDAIGRAWQSAPFEAVVHPDPFPLRLASCREWVQVYHDATARVFLRADESNVKNLKAMGAWLPAGSGFAASDSCGLHRAFTLASAERRLAAGERLRQREQLRVRMEQGDAGARLALAGLYFDMGAYGRTRALLAKVAEPRLGGSLNAAFLDGFAALAMGDEAVGRDCLLEVSRLAAQGGALSDQAAAILRVMLPRISAP
jgi:hypothetical protein